VGEQAGEPVLPGFGQVLFGRNESVPAVFRKGLMQVPAARHHVRQLRPAHEGRVIAVAPRHLLHRAAEQHHRVGGGEGWQGRKRDLQLARAELDLEGAQRQLECGKIFTKNLENRVELVVAVLGQVLVAAGQELDVRRISRLPASDGLVLFEIRLMKFHFQAADHLVRRLLQYIFQQRARA
jgi:hypothetical protein